MLPQKLPMFCQCKPVNRSARLYSHVTSTNTVAVFLDRSDRFFIAQHSVNSPCVFPMEQLSAVFSNVQFTDNNGIFELLLEEGVSCCRLSPFIL